MWMYTIVSGPLSPQSTLQALISRSVCSVGPVRRDSVDVGYRRTDRKPTACVMSPNTSHIQIKVTQQGLYEAQGREAERDASEFNSWCQNSIYASVFNLITFYSLDLICCYYTSWKVCAGTRSLQLNTIMAPNPSTAGEMLIWRPPRPPFVLK